MARLQAGQALEPGRWVLTKSCQSFAAASGVVILLSAPIRTKRPLHEGQLSRTPQGVCVSARVILQFLVMHMSIEFMKSLFNIKKLASVILRFGIETLAVKTHLKKRVSAFCFLIVIGSSLRRYPNGILKGGSEACVIGTFPFS